jgi:transcriptional regulator with XRE-family HTH domain
MDKLDQKIGEKLRKLRDQKSLTMRQVSELINIDYSYISKIENGKIPSLEKLHKLCNLYGISVSSLFGDEIEIPQDLKDIGVKWITFNQEMEKRKLTPEEIKNILDALKIVNKL